MQESSEVQTIGKYRILGTLGRGSMGVVYKGLDPEIGRTVAVKTLRKITSAHFHDAEAALERFKIEARSAGNLRHPNIITIFDVNVEGHIPYIVMDYVEGESLDSILSREKRIELHRMLRYLEQVASGLDAAHEKGVIHRDIKPSNLIVDQSDNVYILDFGVARINESFSEAEKVIRNEPVMGTPGYMSPEQIMNESLDARSDLFSFAIVAFECLTGERPFTGDNFTEVVGNILSATPLSLSSVAEDLPLALEAEFAKALARKREDRFSTAHEMISSFKRAAGIEHSSDLVREAGLTGRELRPRKPSEWKSISGKEDLIREELQKGPVVPLGEDISGSPWKQGGSNGDASHSVLGPVEPTGRSLGPGDMFSHVDDEIAAAAFAGTQGSLLRTLTMLLALGCVLCGGLIVATLYTDMNVIDLIMGKSPQVVQPPGNFSGRAPPKRMIFEPPAVDPVPEGKLISEMTDKELLGVLLSDEVSDTMKLKALREARDRRVPNLVEASIFPLEDDSYIVRSEAIKLLAELGDKRVVPHIVGKLDDHDPFVRRHAAQALQKLGSRAALGYLNGRFRQEQDPSVKSAIKAAIEGINGFPMKR